MQRRFTGGPDLIIFSRETTGDPYRSTTIEPAVLLDRAVVSDPGTKSVKPAMLSLTYASGDSNQPSVERENQRSPSVVEIAHPAPLGGRGRRGSIEESNSSTIVGKMSNPSSRPNREGRSQQYEHLSEGQENPIDTPVSIARSRTSPGEPARISSSDLSRLRQTTSNVPSRTAPSSGQTRRLSTSPQPPLAPSQQHSTSPQHSQPLSSPSKRAIDTLHHILHLKRQITHYPSESPNPPAVSPLPSPLRRLYPLPKTQSGSPSRRSPGSSADAVAAAINEGTRLHQQGPSSTPMLSTPLRVYKTRSSSLATPMQRNETSATSRVDEEHQAARSPSSERRSTPPIAVLGRRESSSESPKASSSIYGDEYDELELSYPSSPNPPPLGTLPDSLPVSNVPVDSPRSAEPIKQASQLSLVDLRPSPSPDENAMMRSSALRYLEHYCQTFDLDRRALTEAYAPDASFSCSSRNLRAQGRESILDALQALGPGILCSGHSVEFDVSYLGPGIGVLLVTLGTMGGTGDSKTGEVGCAMSFMLRPGRTDQERSVWSFFPVPSRFDILFLAGL